VTEQQARVLRKAREILAKRGLCKYALNDGDALNGAVCVRGAVLAATEPRGAAEWHSVLAGEEDHVPAMRLLDEVARREYDAVDAPAYNNAEERTLDEVVAFIDKAIAEAEAVPA
jgi:hypothetical protein